MHETHLLLRMCLQYQSSHRVMLGAWRVADLERFSSNGLPLRPENILFSALNYGAEQKSPWARNYASWNSLQETQKDDQIVKIQN